MVWGLFRTCVDYFTRANEIVTKAVENAGVHMSLAKFVTGLCAMVPVNFVAGYMPKGNARHIYGTLSTLGLLAFTYGRDVEQFVYAGALVYLFMKFFPRKCGYLTWATIFSYQIYLHYERSSEAAWNAGDIDFTGSFMMLVLKLISISMDYQDGMTGRKAKHAFSKMPSVLEYCGYLGGMSGVMVGPHFYYDDYMRYANNLGEYKTLGTSKFPNRWLPATRVTIQAIVCAALFAVSTRVIPRSVVLFNPGQDMPILKRIGLSWIANTGYRSRFYFAWFLSEAAYILAGFGFSGYKEDGVTPKWTNAINAPVRDIELSSSAAFVVTRWNCHTGMWLRTYVYERAGGKGFWPVLVTQLVSGVWHGFSTGYVLFFFNSAILIHCSRVIYRIQKEYVPKKYKRLSDEVHRLHTLFNLNYVAGSYAAGNVYRCLGWFASLYYMGHIEMIAVIVIGTVFFPRKEKKAVEDKKKA
ncbi:lysophospholipid acyltransferase [Chloropicon primus]|uniref:Lysophospholipid acyltransferase n=1 Tax=Chloropicon primus TaxID=1764295 RepID=A0A5B8MYC3_9CHLO|nr:lysophospholipid acyltransferase [Chloropicon primus]UPR04786.1 lysophospholipid acyltransferase [Chloropicon primus]|eukprot:QDZ25589.1 lysophospholipid acyltransferase [Chloropicon primus]